jgi:hypothetical protein
VHSTCKRTPLASSYLCKLKGKIFSYKPTSYLFYYIPTSEKLSCMHFAFSPTHPKPALGEPGSSVSIVSGYGLDERTIEFRPPAEAKGFFLCVQTGSGAHPASCTMGFGGPFPGAKERPGRDADDSPHLVPRSRMSRSYTSSPLKRLRGV